MSNKADFFKSGHTVNETRPKNLPKEGKKRLTIDIDANLHQYLKLKSIHEGKLMRDIIIDAIKKELDL
ncbi:hypothetical protein AB6F95_004626 [Salmonella enterica]